jgi:hypothetical protein
VVFIAVDGRAVLRAVKVGATGPKGIEVIEGLIGGESLVVEPLNRMTDGARIEAPS